MLDIGYGCQVPKDNIVARDPDHDWFREFLRDYYVVTKDYQYLFGSTQAGRRPDRAYYMVPPNYRLGKGQKAFDRERGKKLYEVVLRYLRIEKFYSPLKCHLVGLPAKLAAGWHFYSILISS